jgi:26-hydroxylase
MCEAVKTKMLLRGLQWILSTAAENTSSYRVDVYWTLLVFLIVLTLVRVIQIRRENRHLPPGPCGFPVIGYLPFLKGDYHLHFNDLARKYGAMLSTRLGNQLVVVLGDHKTIREAFRREEFTGRPHTEIINILGGYGE